MAYRAGADLRDPEGNICRSLGIPDTGATLVRPDGFVAWRADSVGPSPTTAVHEALSHVLC